MTPGRMTRSSPRATRRRPRGCRMLARMDGPLEPWDPGPVTRLVLAVLHVAVKKGARGVQMIDHAERRQIPISLHIAGEWIPEMLPPYKLRDALAESLATLCELDLERTTRGNFELSIDGIDYRIDVQLGLGMTTSVFHVGIRPALKLV